MAPVTSPPPHGTEGAPPETDEAADHLLRPQITKVLQVYQMTKPFQVMVGIAENCGHLDFLFVYQDKDTGKIDEKVSLAIKLPVRME